jgi:hypothetical protein
MRKLKRSNRLQSGEWGVVETRSSLHFGHGSPVWIAYWIDLASDGQMSMNIDPDRSANISPAAWAGARDAFGLPTRILVLDDDTAARVRQVVPRRGQVIIAPGDPRLTCMTSSFDELALDELDILPVPAPRAHS